MHHIRTLFVLFVAALVTKIIHTDPVIYIKNKSNRPVHIEPFGPNNNPLASAQFVKSDGDYVENNISINAIRGVRIKYCKNNLECKDTDSVRTQGTIVQFQFHDSKAKKYYLKLDIDGNDEVSLKPQKGRMNRTENLKWSLAGNVNDDRILGPISIASIAIGSYETSSNLPDSMQTNRPAKAESYRTDESTVPEYMRRNQPITGSNTTPVTVESYRTDESSVPEYMRRNQPSARPKSVPVSVDDVSITLMPETLKTETIIP